MKGDGTTDTDTLKVGKNSRTTVTVRNKLGEGDDTAHDFSAQVECTNGQNIIAERPMYFNYKDKWTGGLRHGWDLDHLRQGSKFRV